MQGFQELAAKKMEEFNALKQKSDSLDIAVTTVASAAQGALIGYLLGSFSLDPAAAGGAGANAANPQLAALQKGGPWGQAKNLAVFTGVNAGLSLAIKKSRGGKEDVWGS
jgi:hypothetical protein